MGKKHGHKYERAKKSETRVRKKGGEESKREGELMRQGKREREREIDTYTQHTHTEREGGGRKEKKRQRERDSKIDGETKIERQRGQRNKRDRE